MYLVPPGEMAEPNTMPERVLERMPSSTCVEGDLRLPALFGSC